MKTAIGIPIVDSVPGEAFPDLVRAMMEVYHCTDEVHIITPFNVLPHTRARAAIVQEAHSENCDFLYFLDDDMVIPEGAFKALLQVLVEQKAAAVSGHYYRRGYPYHSVWSVQRQDDQKWYPVDADKDVWKIHCSGLGCAIIDLKWLRDHVQPPWFETEMDNYGPNVTDDVTFFRKIQKAGGLVYGHAGVRCGHLAERRIICDATAEMFRKQFLQLTNPAMA